MLVRLVPGGRDNQTGMVGGEGGAGEGPGRGWGGAGRGWGGAGRGGEKVAVMCQSH